MPDAPWAVLPVKSLVTAKHRLARTLSPAERRRLVLSLLDTAVAAVGPCLEQERILIISPDPQVLAWARRRGLTALQQASTGLNNAVSEAERYALAHGAAALLVLLPDLPLITPADVSRLLELHEPGCQGIIAPGQRGGTHALVLRPPGWLRFAFGPSSFERHWARARIAGVKLASYASPGLTLDVDTAEDLQVALAARPELLQSMQ